MAGEVDTEEMKPADLAGGTVNDQKDTIIERAQGPETQGNEVVENNEEKSGGVVPEYQMDDKPYSVFTHNEKRVIVVCAGLCAFFSPSKHSFSCFAYLTIVLKLSTCALTSWLFSGLKHNTNTLQSPVRSISHHSMSSQKIFMFQILWSICQLQPTW
jgi:hypothetical protein